MIFCFDLLCLSLPDSLLLDGDAVVVIPLLLDDIILGWWTRQHFFGIIEVTF